MKIIYQQEKHLITNVRQIQNVQYIHTVSVSEQTTTEKQNKDTEIDRRSDWWAAYKKLTFILNNRKYIAASCDIKVWSAHIFFMGTNLDSHKTNSTQIENAEYNEKISVKYFLKVQENQ